MRRVELDFTLVNSIDLAFAESLVRSAREDLNDRSIKELEFYYTGIEDPKMKLTVSFQTENADPKHFMAQRHIAIKAIHKRFADRKIIKLTVPELKWGASLKELPLQPDFQHYI